MRRYKIYFVEFLVVVQTEEVIDKVVKEAITKPWLPLPLGLKPPSTEGVLDELSRQGISTVPPQINCRRWHGSHSLWKRKIQWLDGHMHHDITQWPDPTRPGFWCLEEWINDWHRVSHVYGIDFKVKIELL